MFRYSSVLVTLALLTCHSMGQQTPTSIPTSVQTGLLLDAAGPKQREAIKNVYMIVCPLTDPPGSFVYGTGFLLHQGFVVTNAHVVEKCNKSNLFALAPDSQKVAFKKIVQDDGRDLAILVPAVALGQGFTLSTQSDPRPGSEVSTWGYPFAYTGATPLLSVGHVAGYRTDGSHGRPVKHVVVNAAFNHGNSGGPLLLAQENSVIGIVVLTMHFYPEYIKQMLDQMSQATGGWGYGMPITRQDGSQAKLNLSIPQMTAMILDQFYQKTQTMIVEAISASELAAMLNERKQELEH